MPRNEWKQAYRWQWTTTRNTILSLTNAPCSDCRMALGHHQTQCDPSYFSMRQCPVFQTAVLGRTVIGRCSGLTFPIQKWSRAIRASLWLTFLYFLQPTLKTIAVWVLQHFVSNYFASVGIHLRVADSLRSFIVFDELSVSSSMFYAQATSLLQAKDSTRTMEMKKLNECCMFLTGQLMMRLSKELYLELD